MKKNAAAQSFSSHTGDRFTVTHQNIKLTQEWQKCRQNVIKIYELIFYLYSLSPNEDTNKKVLPMTWKWLETNLVMEEVFLFTGERARHTLISIFRTDAKIANKLQI